MGPTPSPENGFWLSRDVRCVQHLWAQGEAMQLSPSPSVSLGVSLPTELCLPGSAAFISLPVVQFGPYGTQTAYRKLLGQQPGAAGIPRSTPDKKQGIIFHFSPISRTRHGQTPWAAPLGCIVCSEARRGAHRGNVSVVSPASAKGQMGGSREGQGCGAAGCLLLYGGVEQCGTTQQWDGWLPWPSEYCRAVPGCCLS